MLGLRLRRNYRRSGRLDRSIWLRRRGRLAGIIGRGLWGLLNRGRRVDRHRRGLLNGHWLRDRRGGLNRPRHGIYPYRVGASFLEVNPHADIRGNRTVPPA